jgi:hypothetical protein
MIKLDTFQWEWEGHTINLACESFGNGRSGFSRFRERSASLRMSSNNPDRQARSFVRVRDR